MKNDMDNKSKNNGRMILLLLLLGAAIIAAAAMNTKNEWADAPSAGMEAPALSVSTLVEDAARAASLRYRTEGGNEVLAYDKENVIDVRLDSQEQRILVVELYIAYNPEEVVVTGVEGEGSIMPMDVLGKEQALKNPGLVHIVRGVVKSDTSEEAGFIGEGSMVKLRVKPLVRGEIELTVDELKTAYVPVESDKKFPFTTLPKSVFAVSQ